jgi:hypothetical protein
MDDDDDAAAASQGRQQPAQYGKIRTVATEPQKQQQVPLVESLERLAILHRANQLSDAEFAAAKAAVLGLSSSPSDRQLKTEDESVPPHPCVIAGKAKALCFGKFDPIDSTSTLQAALNSSASELLIENPGTPWIVRPLFANSNDMHIVLEAGTEVLAKCDEFHGNQDSLLMIRGMRNVTIDGNAAKFRMRRDDYAIPSHGTCSSCKPYSKAEWR